MAVVCFSLRIQNAKYFNLFLIRSGNSPVSQLNVLRANCNTENFIIPDKPKVPPSAFILYLTKHRNQGQKTPGNKEAYKKFQQDMVLKWYALSEPEKKEYTDKARELMSVYKEEIASYKFNLSTEQHEAIAKMELEKKAKKLDRILKSRLSSIAKPKGVRSPRNFFIQSFAKNKPPGTSGAVMVVEANEKWKNLTDQEKEVFENMFKEDQKRYKKEIEEWRNSFSSNWKPDVLNRFRKALEDS